MLSKDNIYPLYIQIERKIIDEIHKGTYMDGSRIPSESELCEEYGVSRVTIRRSLQDLVDNGYLVRKQGKGTFVNGGKIKRSLITADGYTEYIESIGEKPERKIVLKKVAPCPSLIAKRLSIPEGSDILRLGRIMYVNGAPLGYEVSSYPVKSFENLESGIDDRTSIHELLSKKYGIVLKRNYKILNVLLADETIAGHLGCNISDPVYQVDKTEFNQYDEPVYHSWLYYDVNRVSFIIEG
ncbi:UTRA domain-containing protein [Heyndrickxia acidiproducens]|uniref:UTRA domain-containing protein n=1 Tax=Heyndrickxia acidiproducens TaxID=1121084 RepID=UPI00035E1FFA|nr:UTRA domain-containing protein [Heyndrickxia acidiproducens]